MDRARTAVRPLAASDRRDPHEVGRHARLEAVFSWLDGRTVLTHGYVEPPLRIGRCLEEGSALHLIMASSAPGLFGGDCLDQSVDVHGGASVRLTSQSALQVHRSASGGAARVRSRYQVRAGARLSCAWDPTIPFPGCVFDQHIDIDVAGGGRLTWSDGLMAGREGRGERWLFESVAHQLTLRSDGRVAYLERYSLAPDVRLRDPWVAGDHSYFGTVLRVGFSDDRSLAERVQSELRALEGVRAAADLIGDSDLLLVRIAAVSGVPFRQARAAVERAFGQT